MSKLIKQPVDGTHAVYEDAVIPCFLLISKKLDLPYASQHPEKKKASSEVITRGPYFPLYPDGHNSSVCASLRCFACFTGVWGRHAVIYVIYAISSWSFQKPAFCSSPGSDPGVQESCLHHYKGRFSVLCCFGV